MKVILWVNMSSHMKLQGGYFEIGQQLGEAKNQEINETITSFKASHFYKILREYLETTEGKGELQTFKDITEKQLPEIVLELEGVSDGAGVDFNDLFLLNVANEFRAIIREPPVYRLTNGKIYSSIYTGCTNLFLPTPDGEVFFAHTEDVDPNWVAHGLMLTATIYDENSGEILEEWTQYVIPGILPGGTFGFNKNGLLNAHNNVYQVDANKNGIPRSFMCRRLLRCKEVLEVKAALLKEPGISSGFSLHFVELRKGEKSKEKVDNYIFEVAGGDKGTLLATFKPTGFYHHCNIFQHLSYNCHPEDSSIHRSATISQYVNQQRISSLNDLKMILSDSRDNKFPVFRNGVTPDHLATASTGIYDVTGQKLYVYTDKAANSEPDHTFTIPSN